MININGYSFYVLDRTSNIISNECLNKINIKNEYSSVFCQYIIKFLLILSKILS
jgi:hypothetical protein